MSPLLSDAKLASGCILEALKLLANLSNCSSLWPSALLKVRGSIAGLSRVFLWRQDLANNFAARGEGAKLQEERRDQDFGKSPINEEGDASEVAGSSTSGITPEEILCLVLALLTTACLSSDDAAGTIAFHRK